MSVRFHKSVRLGKGVRLNVSKRGISTTVGRPGMSVNIGKRGTYANVGIRGTGLSTRTKIVGSSQGRSRSSSRSSVPRMSADERAAVEWIRVMGARDIVFTVKIVEGQPQVGDKDGNPITDEALLVALKKTQAYKDTLAKAKEAYRQANADAIAGEAALEDEITGVQRKAPDVPAREDYERCLATLKPNVYEPAPFAGPAPNGAAIREALEKEAEDNVKGAPWSRKKLRARYVEERIDARVADETSHWQEAKRAHDAKEAEKAAALNARYQREYEQSRGLLRRLMSGDPEAIEDGAQQVIEALKLPLEMDTRLEFRPQSGTMMLDVDLPEIEMLPQQTSTQLKNGSIRTKDKTQKALRAEYAQCVFGIAVYVAAAAFAASPCVSQAVVSGYSQRRDKVGNLVDDYLYSIRFTRGLFEEGGYRDEDPEQFCMRFENRCNVSTTKAFKAIVPYDD